MLRQHCEGLESRLAESAALPPRRRCFGLSDTSRTVRRSFFTSSIPTQFGTTGSLRTDKHKTGIVRNASKTRKKIQCKKILRLASVTCVTVQRTLAHNSGGSEARRGEARRQGKHYLRATAEL